MDGRRRHHCRRRCLLSCRQSLDADAAAPTHSYA